VFGVPSGASCEISVPADTSRGGVFNLDFARPRPYGVERGSHKQIGLAEAICHGELGALDRPPPFPHPRYSVVMGSTELRQELVDAGGWMGVEPSAAT